tara:strand:+ start:64 stop:318 length:255 start_codon:yes stop_codon:yes gene_type:complete
VAKIMAPVINGCQLNDNPKQTITETKPMESATVSQYLPTCEGRWRIRANSPSTASITPLTTSSAQAIIISSCKISQEQNIAKSK